MSEERKTLGAALHDAWDRVTQPHPVGAEVGADLQAQAAAYDMEVILALYDADREFALYVRVLILI